MGLPSFFKLPRHRKFNFKTRYYNADKEEFDARVAEIYKEIGVQTDKKYVPNIKGQMRGYIQKQKRSASRSNLRLVIIIIVLFIIAFYLFYY